MRRIITGHDEAGRSVFRSAEPVVPTVTSPRADWFEAWATYADDTLPIDPAEHTDRDRYSERHPAFPRVGESYFRVLDFHPQDGPPDVEAQAEAAARLPGLADHLEAEDRSMHTTESVDYGVIISGRITLELDDGQSETLDAGDVFVQNGTRHAWRVTEPCRMAVVLTGVPRGPSTAEVER